MFLTFDLAQPRHPHRRSIDQDRSHHQPSTSVGWLIPSEPERKHHIVAKTDHSTVIVRDGKEAMRITRRTAQKVWE